MRETLARVNSRNIMSLTMLKLLDGGVCFCVSITAFHHFAMNNSFSSSTACCFPSSELIQLAKDV